MTSPVEINDLSTSARTNGVHSNGASSELAQVVDRLAMTESSKIHLDLPRASMAGVLVLLCSNTAGGVSVVLTTRALTMRSFPGETALPGGKMETSDIDISATAIREASEEIGLNLPDLKIITHMPPLLSKNLLFVVPVVAACTTHTAERLLEILKPNAAEVGRIWAWPLRDFLYISQEIQSSATVTDSTTAQSQLAVRYAYQDVPWLLGKPYRLHHFHHCEMASPVTGLTADILLDVALVGYDIAEPGFLRRAPEQLSSNDMLQAVLEGKAGLNGDTRSSLKKMKVAEGPVAGHAAT